MATYEYKCKQCSDKFEVQRSIGGGDIEIKCSKCGSTDVERVYFTFSQNEDVDMTMVRRPT